MSILGRPGVDLGSGAGVAGTPDRLAGGDGYVRAVRHRFGPATGFVTDLRVSVGAGS
jgi:hypothetical protein